MKERESQAGELIGVDSISPPSSASRLTERGRHNGNGMQSPFEVKLKGSNVNDLKILQEEQTIKVFTRVSVKVVGGVNRDTRFIADDGKPAK